MKKYTVTFAFNIEAEDGNQAIDEFLRRIYDSDQTSPDSDDFIAREVKND